MITQNFKEVQQGNLPDYIPRAESEKENKLPGRISRKLEQGMRFREKWQCQSNLMLCTAVLHCKAFIVSSFRPAGAISPEI